MKNTLQAISEMHEFFENKVVSMEMHAVDADNGEKDYKRDYKEKKLELINDAIADLEEMKKEI